jgi:hypothetical protein
LIEYIGNTNPTVSTANPVISGTTLSGNSTYLTLTYPRRAGDASLTYIVQATNDLTGAFATGNGSTITSNNTSTYTDDQVPLNSTNSRRFLRLKVDSTNP